MRLTGQTIQEARQKTKMNQTEFGKSIGVSRHTISYWEKKSSIEAGRYGPRGTLEKIFGALNLPIFFQSNARARGWGITALQKSTLDRQFEKSLTDFEARQEIQLSKRRVICRAKTRKGHPCKLMSEPGRQRCKFHDGMSTGPRTAEGRAKIAAAQKKRWSKWRVDQDR